MGKRVRTSTNSLFSTSHPQTKAITQTISCQLISTNSKLMSNPSNSAAEIAGSAGNFYFEDKAEFHRCGIGQLPLSCNMKNINQSPSRITNDESQSECSFTKDDSHVCRSVPATKGLSGCLTPCPYIHSITTTKLTRNQVKHLSRTQSILSGHDRILRTLFHAFLLSLLLSYCCHGHVLKHQEHHMSRRGLRIKHSNNSSSRSSSSSSSLPSSVSSPLSSSPSSPPLHTTVSDTNLSQNDSTTASSDFTTNSNPDAARNADLVAALISTLEKLQALPQTNATFCLTLEKVSTDGSLEETDYSSHSSSFSIHLSFKLTNLEKLEASTFNDSQEKDNTTDNSMNSVDSRNNNKNSDNIGNAKSLATTYRCVSDPKVLLALILDENGKLVNNFGKRNEGHNASGSGHHSGGSSKDGKKPASIYGILETGNLSRTQVVVVSMCSVIIGMFFMAAAFLRIRNYIKRFQFQKANARRQKFRSFSVALRNSTQSSERRESQGSKASQMNSQTNVSTHEKSTPTTPRREGDITPLLLVTRAAVEQASALEASQGQRSGSLTEDLLEKEKMRTAMNDMTTGNANPAFRQASPNGDIVHRVSPIPNGAKPNGNSVWGGVYPNGARASSSLDATIPTSSSNPRLYAWGNPTQHPQLAKVRGVGLVRASSLGNSRDITASIMHQRGSLKLRNNNRYSVKDVPLHGVANGRYIVANASVDGNGKYVVPKNGMYDHSRYPLEHMKSVSFDVDADYPMGSGTCLTCNAISKRLDMICHNLKDTPCPLVHRHHQNSGPVNHRDTSVEASLQNAGAALSLPVLKDLNKNIQPLRTGAKNYPPSYPSSTSSSPGEGCQHETNTTERLFSSYPNSQQNLCDTGNMIELDHAIGMSKSDDSLRHNRCAENNSKFPEMTGNENEGEGTKVTPCENMEPRHRVNVTNEGDGSDYFDSLNTEGITINCDTTQQLETLIPVDIASCDTISQPVDIVQSHNSSPSSDVLVGSTCTDSLPRKGSACEEKSNLFPGVPPSCRLSRSNENVKSYITVPEKDTHCSLPSVLPPEKCKNYSLDENKDFLVSIDGDEDTSDLQLCEKPLKLALFPNHRRASKKSDSSISQQSLKETERVETGSSLEDCSGEMPCDTTKLLAASTSDEDFKSFEELGIPIHENYFHGDQPTNDYDSPNLLLSSSHHSISEASYLPSATSIELASNPLL